MIGMFLLANIVLGLLLVSVSVDGLPVEMRAEGPGNWGRTWLMASWDVMINYTTLQ